VKRRSFIALLGGAAAAWPLVARAQQPMMPAIGVLSNVSQQLSVGRMRAFHQGLSETGYNEGGNLTIEYRWANGKNDLLPDMAIDLVRRQVTAIAAFSDSSALAAQAATASIPIAFVIGNDPVKLGLVASLNRPGKNITGFTNLNIELGPKRLELLHELVPAVSTIGLLINSAARNAESTVQILPPVARRLGLAMPVLHASTDADIAKTFSSLSEMRVGALLISGDNFYNSRSAKLGELSMRHAIPAIFQTRDFVAGGGLVSYGTSNLDPYRQAGEYIGRILKGEKPADLPVLQPTKFELVINLKAAKALGLTIPQTLLATADEVTE
jgi:ABC-type uncharacterized transport system substrate-binding protein